MYIVYETTNCVNGKYYVGVHKVDSMDFDGYFGSGKLLKRAINKYGENNFFRETLKVFYNKDEAYNFEYNIVNDNFINNCIGKGLDK